MAVWSPSANPDHSYTLRRDGVPVYTGTLGGCVDFAAAFGADDDEIHVGGLLWDTVREERERTLARARGCGLDWDKKTLRRRFQGGDAAVSTAAR